MTVIFCVLVNIANKVATPISWWAVLAGCLLLAAYDALIVRKLLR